MRIAYTPKQERLRQELREYFASLMTPEVRAALAVDRSASNGADRNGDYGDGAVATTEEAAVAHAELASRPCGAATDNNQVSLAERTNGD